MKRRTRLCAYFALLMTKHFQSPVYQRDPEECIEQSVFAEKVNLYAAV